MFQYNVNIKNRKLNFEKSLNNIANISSARRSSKNFIENSKSKDLEEIKKLLNIKKDLICSHKRVNDLINLVSDSYNRDNRILKNLILITLISSPSEYMKESDLITSVIKLEEKIIASNTPINTMHEIYMWLYQEAFSDDSITKDEIILLDKLRLKLNISILLSYEYLSANKLFPKKEGLMHSETEVNTAIRELESDVLIFNSLVNDEQYIVIPTEISNVLKETFGLFLNNRQYKELLSTNVFTKKLLIGYSEKYGFGENTRNLTRDNIVKYFSKMIPTKDLLNYLQKYELESICNKNNISYKKSFTNTEYINTIIDHFSCMEDITKDNNDKSYLVDSIELFGKRDYKTLRDLGYIEKDKEVDKKYEEATTYIFKYGLNQTLVPLVNTEHADGQITWNNRMFLWDNKSVEGKYELKKNIKQFKRYINNEKGHVSSFIVISDSFDENDEKVAFDFFIDTNVPMCLITSLQLKELYYYWKDSSSIFSMAHFQNTGLLKMYTIIR